MAVRETTPHDRLAAELADRGFSVRRGVLPHDLAAALASDTDRALALERSDFPPGDPQHGRLLFAPAHGGAFVTLLDLDELFAPMETLLAPDPIVYTMTTSVLQPGTSGSVGEFHADFDPSRPPGLAVAALVMLDRFTPSSGATEFLVGSHRFASGPPADSGIHTVEGTAGDVVYFDPMVRHRSGFNSDAAPRRAIVIGMVRHWLRQRVDVAALMAATSDPSMLSPTAARRLGLTSAPPRSRAEFLERRSRPRPLS